MATKVCPRCGIEKDVEEFYKSKQAKDGRRCYCKECEKKMNSEREPQYKEYRKRYRESEHGKRVKREYFEKNREKTYVQNKNWQQTLKGRLFSYKRAAKARSIDWLLTDDEFGSFWQQPCSYCGAEIETIGIDRLNNTIGYELKNCVSCCTVCNYMKRDINYENFIEKIMQIYIKIYGGDDGNN